jgi:hypothetical protein
LINMRPSRECPGRVGAQLSVGGDIDGEPRCDRVPQPAGVTLGPRFAWPVAIALDGKGDAEGCIVGHGVGSASESLRHMEPRDRPKPETIAAGPNDPR